MPEKYQIPLILHHVEGHTQEEIAILLGCTYGTLSGRLSRARDLLRERLVRRGVTLTPAVLFYLISQHATLAMHAALATTPRMQRHNLRPGTPPHRFSFRPRRGHFLKEQCEAP